MRSFSQRGLAPVIFIVGILLLSGLIVGGSVLIKQSFKSTPISTSLPTAQTKIISTRSPLPLLVSPTATTTPKPSSSSIFPNQCSSDTDCTEMDTSKDLNQPCSQACIHLGSSSVIGVNQKWFSSQLTITQCHTGFMCTAPLKEDSNYQVKCVNSTCQKVQMSSSN